MHWFVVSRLIHDDLRSAPMAVGTTDVTRPSALLRVVLVVHGIITLAGALVMIIVPTAIPLAVGISLQPNDYLIVYLVAAAELAAAVLSFGATRLTDRSAMGLVVLTLSVLHGASGLLNLLYMAQTGYGPVLVANTCARMVAVVVLVVSWRADGGGHGRRRRPPVPESSTLARSVPDE